MEAQAERLRAYATARGFADCELVTDAGISGRSANRPGFRQVMDAVEAGTVGAVVVYSLSRFARNTITTMRAVEQMNAAGVSFHSVTETIDTSTPMGRVFVTIMAAFAQLESEQIGERVSNVWQYRKGKGQITGQAPYGKMKGADGVTLVLHPVEGQAMNVIASMRKCGATFQAVAADLERRKLPNKAGRVKWNASQVYKIAVRNGIHVKVKGQI